MNYFFILPFYKILTVQSPPTYITTADANQTIADTKSMRVRDALTCSSCSSEYSLRVSRSWSALKPACCTRASDSAMVTAFWVKDRGDVWQCVREY